MQSTPVAVLVLALAASVPSQSVPSSLTLVGSYSSATLGVRAGAGGIEFDPAGTTLFINDPNADQVISLTVVRNASGRITGFRSPVLVVVSRSAAGSSLDGGLTFSNVGTMMMTNWQSAELEQYVPATKVHTVVSLRTVGVPGSPGGAEFYPRNSSLLVADYDNGSIYEVPLTLKSDLTYTLGPATKFLDTQNGIDGFEWIPRGPFGGNRGMLVVDYDKAQINLVALDPSTGRPHVDAAGNARPVQVFLRMGEPMDVEFDPLTGDLFVTDYSSGAVTMRQYSGEIVGGLDGVFSIFGPGCPRAGGGVPTLGVPTGAVRAGQPVTIQVSGAPPSQTMSFLVFGVGPTGNLGGALFPSTTCRVHVQPMISAPVPTNAQGIGSISATLPASAFGIGLMVQGWALSRGANVLDLTVSDAGVVLVGK